MTDVFTVIGFIVCVVFGFPLAFIVLDKAADKIARALRDAMRP